VISETQQKPVDEKTKGSHAAVYVTEQKLYNYLKITKKE